eukprot:267381_1
MSTTAASYRRFVRTFGKKRRETDKPGDINTRNNPTMDLDEATGITAHLSYTPTKGKPNPLNHNTTSTTAASYRRFMNEKQDEKTDDEATANKEDKFNIKTKSVESLQKTQLLDEVATQKQSSSPSDCVVLNGALNNEDG